MKRNKTFSLLVLALPLFLARGAYAETVPTTAVVGKYGFDWLRPTKAKCAAITDQNLAGVKSCTHSDANSPGSFTGKKDYYTCRVSKASEYMIYSSQSRCKEELDVMKANGD